MAVINKGIYAITDFNTLNDREVLSLTEQLLRAGLCLLQYRDKTATVDQKEKRGRALQVLCREYNTPFIVNDDVTLVKRIKADGVHLGQEDIPIEQARECLGNVIIGQSCYNKLAAARQAQLSGADYVAFGAFYPSRVKTEAVRATPALLAEATREISVPIVAIGGITPKNAKVLIDNGADILAVITALYGITDSVTALTEFKKLFTQEQA